MMKLNISVIGTKQKMAIGICVTATVTILHILSCIEEKATIRCGSITYEQKFTNKSLTEDFEKQFKNYLDIVNGKYKNIIALLLEHNAELEMSGSLDEFIAQQAAAEKNYGLLQKSRSGKKEKAPRT